LDAAISDDAQQAGHADLHAKLSGPLEPPPAVGSTVSVTGVFTGYAPTPFAFAMDQAEVGP